jgi:MFS family permease
MHELGPLAINRGHGQRLAEAFDSPYSWRVIILTLVITSLSFGAVTSVPILLKQIAAEWGSGVRSISLVHLSAMMGAGFGSLILGRMVDQFGFFKIAVAGAVATTVGLALAAQARELLTLHLAFGLLVGGMGQAAFFSPITAESSRWFCRHRAFAITVAASGQSLGGLIAPFVLRGWSDAYGWRTALLMYGVTAGFAMLLCALVFRRTAPGSAVHASVREAAKPLGSAVRQRIFLLCLALCLSNLAGFIAIGHLTSYGDEQGLSSALSATLISTLLGVALLSRLSIQALGVRWGPLRTLLAMTAVQWLGTLVLLSGHGFGSILSGAVLMGLGFGGYLPSYPLILRAMFPNHQAGRRISEVYFLVFMTAGLGSWLGGYLRDLTGSYTASFGLAVASSGLALIALGVVCLTSRASPQGARDAKFESGPI